MSTGVDSGHVDKAQKPSPKGHNALERSNGVIIEKDPRVTTWVAQEPTLWGNQQVQHVLVLLNPAYNPGKYTIAQVPEGAKISLSNTSGVVLSLALKDDPRVAYSLESLPVDVSGAKTPLHISRELEPGVQFDFWVVPEGFELEKTGKYTGVIRRISN